MYPPKSSSQYARLEAKGYSEASIRAYIGVKAEGMKQDLKWNSETIQTYLLYSRAKTSAKIITRFPS
jgi:hypothetical protein